MGTRKIEARSKSAWIVRILLSALLGIGLGLGAGIASRWDRCAPIVLVAFLAGIFTFSVVAVVMVGTERSRVQRCQLRDLGMEPTLRNYRLVRSVRMSGGLVQRGWVVAMEPFPAVAAEWPEVPGYMVKRVVGLPGETIEVRGDVVTIDGERLDEPYAVKGAAMDAGPTTLGADEYFVMADNRVMPNDSRKYGPVSRQLIRRHVTRSRWSRRRGKTYLP